MWSSNRRGQNERVLGSQEAATVSVNSIKSAIAAESGILGRVKNIVDRIRRWDFVTSRDQIAFLRAFIRPMRQGIPELETAAYLMEHGSPGVKKLTALTSESLAETGRITDKLHRYISPFYASALRLMERTQGKNFPDSLDAITKMMATGNKILFGLLRPSILPAAYLSMFSGVLVFVIAPQMPIFSEAIKDQSAINELLRLDSFLKIWLVPILALAAVGFFVGRAALRSVVTPWRIRYLDPTILVLYRQFVAFGYLKKYALLRSAGLSAQEIFTSLAENGSAYERHHAVASLEILSNGPETEEHALDTGLLSPRNWGMIKLMLKGGQTEDILSSINSAADEIEERLTTSVKSWGVGISVVAWLSLVYVVMVVANVVVGADPT